MNDVSLVGRDTFLWFPHSRLAELAVDTNKRITLIHKYLISRITLRSLVVAPKSWSKCCAGPSVAVQPLLLLPLSHDAR